MKRFARKTAPQVVNGRVQHKNRWRSEPSYYGTPRVAIARRRPGPGFQHVLSRSDVFNFIQLVPGWNDLALGLNRILLDAGSHRFGWFRPGVVAVCAAPRDLAIGYDWCYFQRDRRILDRLKVPYAVVEEDHDGGKQDDVICQFTRPALRCFLLVNTLVHELGHHHDYITNRQRRCTRGEEYAENYALRLENVLWQRYLEVFGDPTAGD